MAGGVKVVHVDDVPMERMQERDGWAISEFRLPISGADGSATTVFHSIFRAGSTHAKHLHQRCDELVAYLGGRGVVGQSEGRDEVTAGHRRRIPQGSVHFFSNQSQDEEALALGFYMGAGSVADTGYEYRGDVEQDDVTRPFKGFNEGTLVRVEETPTLDTSAFQAWAQAQVRLSIGSSTGSANALLDVELPPGGAIDRHRLDNCEQLYFVTAGAGVAESSEDATPVRPGSFIFVPQGAEFALRNTGDADPLAIVGVLTGAGSLAEAGYSPA